MKLSSAGMLLLCLWHSPGVVQGQSQTLWPVLAARVETLSQQLDSLDMQGMALDDQGKNLVREITHLQSKSTLSRGERRQLDDLMRRAQNLDSQNSRWKQTKLQTLHLFGLTLDQLLQKIQSRIDSLTSMASARPEALSAWRTELQQWSGLSRSSAADPGQWQAITAHPGESSRTLRLKGDLLLDRADKLREEATTASKRIESLSREVRIRERVADLDRELSLFNEGEELFARSGRGDNTQTSEALPNYEIDGVRNNLFGSKTSIILDRPILELSGPLPSSPLTLKAWIETLKNYESRLHREADSLNTQARRFHSQAGRQ